MKTVAILGASGMLGSTLIEVFSRQRDFDLIATVRNDADRRSLERQYPAIAWRHLDAETCTVHDVSEATAGASWVINAIGVIKQKIVDSDDTIAERALRVNALFPFLMTHAIAQRAFKTIQIATDCVFSGSGAGHYAESAAHDCHDVYGKTKSLGEVHSPSLCNLRCSIVGPERNSNLSLLNWFLSNPPNARINGFVNHFWNGITSLHFAKICMGMIRHDLALENSRHLVPRDEISKEGLLRLFGEAFGRKDIVVAPVHAATAINRTLTTEDPAWSIKLWNAAGYARPPSIAEMVYELAEYMGQAHGQTAARTFIDRRMT